jgi:hypothetical protein
MGSIQQTCVLDYSTSSGIRTEVGETSGRGSEQNILIAKVIWRLRTLWISAGSSSMLSPSAKKCHLIIEVQSAALNCECAAGQLCRSGTRGGTWTVDILRPPSWQRLAWEQGELRSKSGAGSFEAPLFLWALMASRTV